MSPCEAAYSSVNPNKGEADAGLPVLGRLEDEVVQRLADLAVSGGGRARGELPGVVGEGGLVASAQRGSAAARVRVLAVEGWSGRMRGGRRRRGSACA